MEDSTEEKTTMTLDEAIDRVHADNPEMERDEIVGNLTTMAQGLFVATVGPLVSGGVPPVLTYLVGRMIVDRRFGQGRDESGVIEAMDVIYEKIASDLREDPRFDVNAAGGQA